MDKIKSILIRSPNWIGDQVLAYPFFYYLRQIFPKARVTVGCVPWVQSIQFRKQVDEVLVLPRPFRRSLMSQWEAFETGAKDLRAKGPWDLGILLPNSLSSAWLFFRAGVVRRLGYSSEGRGLLLTQKREWKEDSGAHRADDYLGLLQGFSKAPLIGRKFWGVPPENDLDLGEPGVLRQFDAEKEWPEAEPIEPPQGPYWVLAPGSNAESRRWPLDSFTSLARLMYEETGCPGVIVGGKADVSLAQQMIEAAPEVQLIDLTAQGDVAAYWKVFRKASFSVCNDSGLAHVASLCGSPVQVIWGAGHPSKTRPIGPGKVQVLVNPVECWPCGKNTCSQVREEYLGCLKGIHPEAVWKEIKTGIRSEILK